MDIRAQLCSKIEQGYASCELRPFSATAAIEAAHVKGQLQTDSSRQAEQFRGFLVRLSGRQRKRKKPHTAPALVGGHMGVVVDFRHARARLIGRSPSLCPIPTPP